MIAPANAVVISQESLESDDPYEVVGSNVDFVNALLGEYLRADEIAVDALRSYYVDYFLAQLENGGFSQFVYNSGWSEDVVRLVREGLREMGAVQHLALFEETSEQIAALGPERLRAYLESEYFDENEERDALNVMGADFSGISEAEDLIELNAAWLRSLPGLVALPEAELDAEAKRRGAALSDREARVAAALESEPRYMKLIRALCAATGHELSHITAGDPSHEYEGQRVVAWHFITDRGHHYMVEAGGKAIMFEGSARSRVAEVDAPEE
ncbi:MAG: DMP19 family protein [Actinomycetota bacterium]